MGNTYKVTDTIWYVGVDDHVTDLFEGQYPVLSGMSYNSYVILDEKVAVMDTVDVRFGKEWLSNLMQVLDGRRPDYLVVQHMEMDHAANIGLFMEHYPEAVIVSNERAFIMMRQFFNTSFEGRRHVVEHGASLLLGRHNLNFVFAPMVHWPEVMVTYDSYERVLFSADGFGKFGSQDTREEWDDEARRYYIGIVGKYGEQVQSLLKAASGLDIQKILPLHGPVLTDNLGHYLKKYDIWSSYQVETEGIVIAYTTVYGNTRQAVEILAFLLQRRGCPNVVVHDLARCSMSQAVADAFRYGKLVLATTTYNGGIYPFMHDYLHRLAEHNFQNRTIALVENGSWAPSASMGMRKMLEGCKNLKYTKNSVQIHSAVSPDNIKELDVLANELCREYIAASPVLAQKDDAAAMFKIGYGLYVVTCNDGMRDNGLIVNTVSQVADAPERIAVCINKKNYSHEIIQRTRKLNVNILSTEASFSIFQRFGFQSGRTADKFMGIEFNRTDNGLPFLKKGINAVISLEAEQYMDLGSHGMFLCRVAERRVVSDQDTMTYNYYQSHIKPKPQPDGKKGWVCKVCGYVYEGEELPLGYVCPLCKHGASDFEKQQ